MTPEQMTALAARLQKAANERGNLPDDSEALAADLDTAADLIAKMAEREPEQGSIVVTTDADQNVVAVTLNDENDQVQRVVWERKVPPRDGTALNRYREHTAGCEPDTPKERLRAFCSFAMRGHDWIDVEPFFDALPDDTALLRQTYTALTHLWHTTPERDPAMDEALAAMKALRARLDSAPNRSEE